MNYTRAPERRESNHVRQTAASVETAKEVKIFGLIVLRFVSAFSAA